MWKEKSHANKNLNSQLCGFFFLHNATHFTTFRLMTDKSPDPSPDRSRFSWDRFINDGQERLAALIDIEPPSADAVPASGLVGPKQSSTTTNTETAIASVKDEVDPKICVPGIEITGEPFGKSMPSLVATTPLEVEGNLVGPGAGGSKTSGGKSSSTLDRMRRTIKRHTGQQGKVTGGETDHSTAKKTDKHVKTRSKHRSKSNSDSSPTSTAHTVSAPAADTVADSVGTTMVDKLMDRLVTSALPTVSFKTSDADWRAQNLKGQPPFSINLMTNNFRKMTARTGIAFEIIYTFLEIISWKDPVFTTAVLAIYSFVVLNPRLVPIVPIFILLSHIMVPSYMYRHPPDSTFIKPVNPIPAEGAALADPVIPKPVPELSREFFYNVVDTQNFMVLYIDAFDLGLEFLRRFAFFESDECTSSLVFSVLLGSSVVIYLLTPLIIQYTPWKLVFLSAGWGFAGITHPRFREQFIVPLKLHLRDTREKGKKTLEKVVTTTRARVASVRHKTNRSESFASDVSAIFDNASVSSHVLTTDDEDHMRSDQDNEDDLSSTFSSSSDSDDSEENQVQEKPDTLLEKYNKFWGQVDLLARVEFNLIEPHEKRETEVFELQLTYKPASPTSSAPYHWSSSAFASHPYLPLTRGPVTNLNFMSCTTLTEVLAPPEWTFASWSRWKLDLDLGWVDRRGMPTVAKTGDTFVELGARNNDSDFIVNEKWVRDKYPVSFGTGAATTSSAAPPLTVTTAALELLGLDEVPVDENGEKYKLYLRRRRWIRVCVRQSKVPALV